MPRECRAPGPCVGSRARAFGGPPAAGYLHYNKEGWRGYKRGRGIPSYKPGRGLPREKEQRRMRFRSTHHHHPSPPPTPVSVPADFCSLAYLPPRCPLEPATAVTQRRRLFYAVGARLRPSAGQLPSSSGHAQELMTTPPFPCSSYSGHNLCHRRELGSQD